MKILNNSHQFSSFLHNRNFNFLSRLIDLTIRLVYQALILGSPQIAPTVSFYHGALGVVIIGLSVIEDDCEIHVHVVLGGSGCGQGAPYLERGLIVQAGAKVIGPVRIGTGSVIAANVVVIIDVPPYCLVAGVRQSLSAQESIAKPAGMLHQVNR